MNAKGAKMNDEVTTGEVGGGHANKRYDRMHPHGRPPLPRSVAHDRLQVGAGDPIVRCGGVLMMNACGQILVGFNEKRQVWDIPQGVCEEGETVPECAARELREETGLSVEPGQLYPICAARHQTPEFAYPFENHVYMGPVLQDGQQAYNREPEKCKDLHWVAPCQLQFPRGLSLRLALVLLGRTE
jgi:ADP-ribose pyrophosphatase YjhB (NUDIX family)